jgi:dihydroorotase
LNERGGYDTNTKMNPPLREDADRAAMIDGLRDGSIDAIATDHAPHHADEKALEFDRAPFGITGLETAVPLCFDRLVHTGVLGVPRLVELLSSNPARILGVPGGTLAEGAVADITLLAPDAPVTIRVAESRSKARNSPFDGWSLKGAVAATIVAGRPVFRNAAVFGADRLGAQGWP